MVDIRQQRTMVESSPAPKSLIVESEDSAVVPDVRAVDMNVLAQVLDEAIAEVTAASKATAPVKKSIGQKLPHAFQHRLRRRGAAVVTTPDPPPYNGMRVDGNPIVFYYRSNYRLFVELGRYYQSDLQRDDPRLFNALRNSLKGKAWREIVTEADALLRGAGETPSILGKPLRDIEDLNELLPARRVAPARRPALSGHRHAPLPLEAAE